MLGAKNLDLDAVIELKVDEAALLARIAKRANDTLARGGTVRADDTPEAFKARLDAYHAETAPVADFYAKKGVLKTVDGMAPVDAVASSIDQLLGGAVRTVRGLTRFCESCGARRRAAFVPPGPLLPNAMRALGIFFSSLPASARISAPAPVENRRDRVQASSMMKRPEECCSAAQSSQRRGICRWATHGPSRTRTV